MHLLRRDGVLGLPSPFSGSREGEPGGGTGRERDRSSSVGAQNADLHAC